jgi:hypothetical protein
MITQGHDTPATDEGMTMTDHTTASPVLANITVPAVLVHVGFAAVLLLALWPVRSRAAGLLRRWGVGDPTELETDEALRYLRRRRLCYPGLYLAISLGASLVAPEPAPLPALVLAVLLAGGLIADVIGWQPGTAATSADTSAPRQPARGQPARALIPWWSFTLASVLFGAVELLGGAGLLGHRWALAVIPSPGLALGLGSAAVLASAATIWLAAHRPTRGSARAHEALRLRSARVGLGLGMLALSTIGASGGSPIGLAVAALGLAGALATTAPVRNRTPTGAAPSDAAST